MRALARLLSPALLALAATAALGQQEGFRAFVIPVDSASDLGQWLTQDPAPRGPYPAVLSEIRIGQKVQLPIVVAGLRPPAKGVLNLSADWALIGPDGKQVHSAPGCCHAAITDRPDLSIVMLGNTTTLEFDSRDAPGIYTVNVTVTDGSRTATWSEPILLVPGTADAKPATPAPQPAPPETGAAR